MPEDFGNYNGMDYKRKVCKACRSDQQKEWAKKNPDKEKAIRDRMKKKNPNLHKESYRRILKKNPDYIREKNYKASFGITIDQYELMFNFQGGLCAICRKPETIMDRGKIRRLAVDHCHATGKIRGLLCGKCNKAIGLVDENLLVLSAMSEYLLKHQQR